MDDGLHDKMMYGETQDPRDAARHCKGCGGVIPDDAESDYCSDGCEMDDYEDRRDREIQRQIDRYRDK